MEVGWPALHAQFGAGYMRLRDFRRDFIAALELALAAYADAHVSLGERGVVLRPSRPAVARLARAKSNPGQTRWPRAESKDGSGFGSE